MATNDIKTLAEGGSANVLSQAAYAALTSFLDSGFSTGIVPSNQMNKVLRQATLMAYVLAQHIVNTTGLDVLDNGAPATILANLTTAIKNTVFQVYAGNPNGNVAGVAATVGVTAPSVLWDTTNKIFWVCTTTGNSSTAVWLASTSGSSGAVNYCPTSTGSANTQVVTPAVPVILQPGLALSFVAGFTNTAAMTLEASGTGARFIRKDSPTGPIALTGGEWVAGNVITVRYDGTNYHMLSTAQGTAALANQSSMTGKVAAVSGAITAGHIATFSDNLGTVQDGGPAGVAGAPFALNAANSGLTIGPGDYMVNTSAGPVSVTLTTTAAGGSWHFTDQEKTWGTNNFTVNAPAGVNIVCNGLTFQTLTADLSGYEFFISFNGTNLGVG